MNYPSIRKKLWGGALWSPSYFAGSCGVVLLSLLSGSTSSSSRRRTRRTKPDGCAVRALDPALKGEVCRATDQEIVYIAGNHEYYQKAA